MTEGEFPSFLSLKQVMALHRRSLAEQGGMDGVRDPGAVDSALASAQNTRLYAGGDIFDIAAADALHIAEAQAFLDGNKRTAIASAIAFLAANRCIDQGDDRHQCAADGQGGAGGGVAETISACGRWLTFADGNQTAPKRSAKFLAT